ncbi:DUF2130 domain-containing protein [Anatilimnocola aggregata]|uniref:DUF2130 domain-containing protein n=1 Tax=Anatilimnocola aggregata TaxID=2528021 RepID=UPI00192E702C|nr:DUF2130 domain-containing protein [Anatilimnocola aggregata]
MNNTLSCPNCNHEIELTELMRTQVASQIRGELDAHAATRQRELDKQREEVARQKLQLDKDREAVAEQIRTQVEQQRTVLLTEAKKRAEDAVAVEIADRDERLKELSTSLDSARMQELDLRKMQRQLQSEKDSLKLEVQRQLDAQRSQLITEAKAQFDVEHAFKQAEKDKTIADMTVKLREMQRKIEQGSQQLQGEVQELALERMLADTFPTDEIAPVSKGVLGGDCMQVAINGSGTACGRILWESKRTKRWGGDWLAKARDDARASRADVVVIVSETLPDGIQGFAPVEGVWVCGWAAAKSLATALRHGLIEVGKARVALVGQHAKQELVYNYLASSEFAHRVGGIAEAFATMQTDLESEKRAFKKQWSKREKQLERAIMNTTSLYGDLQGIIGASLPKIAGLETMLIEDQREV